MNCNSKFPRHILRSATVSRSFHPLGAAYPVYIGFPFYGTFFPCEWLSADAAFHFSRKRDRLFQETISPAVRMSIPFLRTISKPSSYMPGVYLPRILHPHPQLLHRLFLNPGHILSCQVRDKKLINFLLVLLCLQRQNHIFGFGRQRFPCSPNLLGIAVPQSVSAPPQQCPPKIFPRLNLLL